MSHKLVTLLITAARASELNGDEVNSLVRAAAEIDHCASELDRGINAPHYITQSSAGATVAERNHTNILRCDGGIATTLAECVRRLETTKTQQLYVALSDQVDLTAVDHQTLLLRHMKTTKTVCTAVEGKVGFPAIFSRSQFSTLTGLETDSELRALLQQLPDEQRVVLDNAAVASEHRLFP